MAQPIALPNAAQQFVVSPRGFSDKVVQRLVFGAGVQWVNPCRNRLDALARQRKHQTSTIISQS